MVDNPFQPPAKSGQTEHPITSWPPKNVLEAAMLGAKLGIKWTTYLLGPLSVLAFLLMFLANIERVHQRQHYGQSDFVFWWETLSSQVAPLGGFVFCCVLGALLGGIISTMAFLFLVHAPRHQRSGGPET